MVQRWARSSTAGGSQPHEGACGEVPQPSKSMQLGESMEEAGVFTTGVAIGERTHIDQSMIPPRLLVLWAQKRSEPIGSQSEAAGRGQPAVSCCRQCPLRRHQLKDTIRFHHTAPLHVLEPTGMSAAMPSQWSRTEPPLRGHSLYLEPVQLRVMQCSQLDQYRQSLHWDGLRCSRFGHRHYRTCLLYTSPSPRD